MIDSPFFGIACCTILSMASGMSQAHLHTLERPLLSVRVHAKRHAGAGSQRGQKQFVRIRSPVITLTGRFVRLEAVLSNSYPLKKTLALRIYDTVLDISHQCMCTRDDARSLTYCPLLTRPKSLTQNSFEYFAGAALG